MYEAKLEFPGGFKPKKPSMGGWDNFWNHALLFTGKSFTIEIKHNGWDLRLSQSRSLLVSSWE